MPADEAAERARAAQPGAAQSGAARAAAHIPQRLHDRGAAQAELERDPAAARIAPDATQRPDPAPAWQEPSRIDATVRADVRSEAEVRNAGRGEVPRAPAANATEAVASGMLAGTLATPVSPTAHSPTVITVHTSIGAAGWERELSDKLARVVLRHDRIEIRVAPAELGPVEIRVDLGAGPASLAIVASHAATRDALEQALPQLREALAAQGIALGDATVRDGHAGADAHAQHARPHPRSVPNLLAGGLAPATTVLAPRRPDRLVDTFA
jgi:flagellar hook-length control protein FliK